MSRPKVEYDRARQDVIEAIQILNRAKGRFDNLSPSEEDAAIVADIDPANIKFYVNGALVATNTANAPTAANFLAPMVCVTTLTSSGKSLASNAAALSTK